MEERLIRWCGALALGLALALAGVPGAGGGVGAASAEPLEAAVKATFLYKFIAFVSWPQTAFAAADSPFRLCVEGSDPFGELLDRAVAGQSAGGRPIELVRRPQFEKGAGCHVLYGTAPMDRLRGEPVLTVSDADAPGGSGAGAVITFMLREDRVRFVIDAAAAQDNRLAISSKLMSLAVRQ
ncbi:YfiR family protein [Azospirillum sp. TSH100]|uniref:YfiR family protein n=1 Tax=Azospirillum sp. TSH100 TaxID=652764 RepID=UPI0018EE59D7|nr:YfiR family protein [Azospirillum sp. TSH100]